MVLTICDLRHILENPDLLNRTVFYNFTGNGTPIPLDNDAVERLIAAFLPTLYEFQIRR